MLHKWKATQVVTKHLSLPLLAWQASPKASSTERYLELLLKQKSNENNLLLWRRVRGEWLMTMAPRKSPSRVTERLFTYRGNPFSPFLMCRNYLYACDQQNAWNENPNPALAQALNSPGHEPKPGSVMERDTPHRHTELRCSMTTSSCLPSPVTSHTDFSFPSPAFSTTEPMRISCWSKALSAVVTTQTPFKGFGEVAWFFRGNLVLPWGMWHLHRAGGSPAVLGAHRSISRSG